MEICSNLGRKLSLFTFWAQSAQNGPFRAEKRAWRPLEAVPLSGVAERKLRAASTDPVAKVSERFESIGPLENVYTGFLNDCTENTGHFWLYFGVFSAVRAQHGPKSWSIVVCTYTDHVLSTACDFETSRRRTNFGGGLLACCCCLLLLFCQKDFNYYYNYNYYYY